MGQCVKIRKCIIGEKCHTAFIVPPPIQNAMSKNAFEFLRRYLHFDDNRNKKPHTHPSYDPLWKIRWVLENVMDCLRNAYRPG